MITNLHILSLLCLAFSCCCCCLNEWHAIRRIHVNGLLHAQLGALRTEGEAFVDQRLAGFEDRIASHSEI